MQNLPLHLLGSAAASLGSDTIHLWQLPYTRALGRAPLLSVLASYLHVPVASMALEEDPHGRPQLPEPLREKLKFNWSHSGELAVIAIARGVVPGVDIERLRPRPRALELAQRFFHPQEYAQLAALDDAARAPAFLRLWTAKEAVLKAIGRGIAFGLGRLLIDGGQALSLSWLDGDNAAAWQLQALSVPSGYVGHVAWRGPPQQIQAWTLAHAP